MVIERATVKLVLVLVFLFMSQSEQNVPMGEANAIQLTYIWDGALGISYSRPSTVAVSSVKAKDK